MNLAQRSCATVCFRRKTPNISRKSSLWLEIETCPKVTIHIAMLPDLALHVIPVDVIDHSQLIQNIQTVSHQANTGVCRWSKLTLHFP